jgi:UDP-N-acetylglucosamine--N-acetylmuramyl-(pentapeptide) pyrophosphoryl-undecaprenol N-acetylglucosamine transferase
MPLIDGATARAIHIRCPPAGRFRSIRSGFMGDESGRSATMTPAPLDFVGQRVLFVASTGGHLLELDLLAPGMNAAPDSAWVTFDSAQSRSVLAGRPVTYVPYISPRDYRATAAAIRKVAAVIRRERPVAVVSTGAGIAISAFIAARARGVSAHYVESVSRTNGPSLTGRVVAALRLAELHTQHEAWADNRWRPYPSVLSDLDVTVLPDADLWTAPRLFVTLGTISPYRFDALVDAVLHAGLADERTVWQLGATTRTDLPGHAFAVMPAEDFQACIRQADVVITHAGVGTIIELLGAGRVPVVVPRRVSRDEHVDDHQTQIATLVEAKGVAVVREADQLDLGAVRQAMRTRVTPSMTSSA